MQFCLSSKNIESVNISIESPIVGEPKDITLSMSLFLSGNLFVNSSFNLFWLIFSNFQSWHLEIIV